MKRRQFLRYGLAGLALAAGPHLGAGRARSQSVSWGALPEDPLYWPSGRPRPEYKILEVHLSGGLSAFESFYVMTDRSSTLGGPWFGAQSVIDKLDWSGCGPSAPAGALQTVAFDRDGIGDVHLGPVTAPLWPFKDQMRVLVLRHDFEPHEAAIPLSLTGLPPGNPKFAGLGAAIEHRFDRAASGRVEPYAYVLIPDELGIDDDSFQGMHATGFHGGRFRPLVLKITTVTASATDPFFDRLQRPRISARANDLLRQYAAQYRDRLRHSARPGVPARSSEFAGYEAALNAVLNAPALDSILRATLTTPASPATCVGSTTPTVTVPRPDRRGDYAGAMLRTAARLLARGESSGGARYVGIVDGGISRTTGGGYDVHGGDEYPSMYVNLWNCLSALAAQLQRPAPGVAPDPDQINLNDTIVFLNTEFGRDPDFNPGRDHWPKGYVNILIGGPIDAGIDGRIERDGVADRLNAFTPADVHAGLLMAAGVDPFADENFGVGDVSSRVRGQTEPESAEKIRTSVLGVI